MAYACLIGFTLIRPSSDSWYKWLAYNRLCRCIAHFVSKCAIGGGGGNGSPSVLPCLSVRSVNLAPLAFACFYWFWLLGGFVSTLRPRVSAALGHRFGVAFVGCCSLHRLWCCFRWLRSLASSGLACSPLPLVGGSLAP